MFLCLWFGGWLGFLLCWGLFWLSAWFLVLGSGVFLVLALCFCFMRLCGVGGGFWGVLGLGVICASGLHSCVVWGWGLGVRLGSRVVRGSGVPGSSAVVVGGCRLCFSPGWGVGVGFFLLVVVGVLGVLFSAWHSLVSSVLVWVFVVLVGVGGFGGVGLGWGLFSPAVIAWLGLVPALRWLWGWCWFGFGFVWRV